MRYRLFLLDGAGKVRARFGLECPNDEAAISDAISFANGEPFEIWQETRLVFERAAYSANEHQPAAKTQRPAP
jgi:hypothetical protein